MIEEFSPQPEEQSKQPIKNLAYITEEGSPDYEFGICYLIDKQEEAIVYSPGDKSYDVKHNVGKKITFTGLHPARKGNRKWVAKAAPLELMPEELRSEIVTPASQLAQTVEHKRAKLQEPKPNLFDLMQGDEKTESQKPKKRKSQMSIKPETNELLNKVIEAKGFRPKDRFIKGIILNQIIKYAISTGFIDND